MTEKQFIWNRTDEPLYGQNKNYLYFFVYFKITVLKITP